MSLQPWISSLPAALAQGDPDLNFSSCNLPERPSGCWRRPLDCCGATPNSAQGLTPGSLL